MDVLGEPLGAVPTASEAIYVGLGNALYSLTFLGAPIYGYLSVFIDE